MSPQESRRRVIDSLFDERTLISLKEKGMYDDYVQGHISINRIYNQLKDQGI